MDCLPFVRIGAEDGAEDVVGSEDGSEDGSDDGDLLGWPDKDGLDDGDLLGWPDKDGSDDGDLLGWPDKDGSDDGDLLGLPDKEGTSLGVSLGWPDNGSHMAEKASNSKYTYTGHTRLTGFPARCFWPTSVPPRYPSPSKASLVKLPEFQHLFLVLGSC